MIVLMYTGGKDIGLKYNELEDNLRLSHESNNKPTSATGLAACFKLAVELNDGSVGTVSEAPELRRMLKQVKLRTSSPSEMLIKQRACTLDLIVTKV